MLQNILPIVLAAFLAGIVVIYFYQEHVREKKLQIRVKKLYASQLFEDMIPMLSAAKHHSVEQLMLDKKGVSVRYLHSDSPETAFLMRPNGYAYLTPEQQEAMRVMLEECLPKLTDSASYHVSRKRVRQLNGDVEFMYQYTMTTAYKTRLCRAPYYDGTLQTRSW